MPPKQLQAKKTFHKRRGWKRHEERLPKVIENPKKAIFIRGRQSSQALKGAMDDLSQYKKPYCLKFNNKHDFAPFDDDSQFEAYSQTRDCSLFLFGSHTKKRPNNLTFIRMFDGHILDMMEFGIVEYKGIAEFPGSKPPTAPRLSFTFVGSAFESDETLKMFKSVLVDFYRQDAQQKYCIDELSCMMVVVAHEGKVYISVHAVELKGGNVSTHEVGPRLVLAPGRTQFATDDHRQEAMRAPPQIQKAKKVKNVKKDMFGQKIGKVHVNRQKLDDLNRKTKRMKALRLPKTTTKPTE